MFKGGSSNPAVTTDIIRTHITVQDSIKTTLKWPFNTHATGNFRPQITYIKHDGDIQYKHRIQHVNIIGIIYTRHATVHHSKRRQFITSPMLLHLTRHHFVKIIRKYWPKWPYWPYWPYSPYWLYWPYDCNDRMLKYWPNLQNSTGLMKIFWHQQNLEDLLGTVDFDYLKQTI